MSPGPSRLGKRTTVTAACEECRRRKQRCSADRPKCQNCQTRNVRCRYETVAIDETHNRAVKRKHSELMNRHNQYEELIDLLRRTHDHEAAAILRDLRSGADVSSLVSRNRLDNAQLLAELALTPETRFRYVLPVTKTIPSWLKTSDNPYLDTALYEHETRGSKAYESPVYYVPYHAAKLVDKELESVQVSAWTTVSTDEHLLRQLLEIYFLHEYANIAPFQKDRLLSDMRTGRTRYCSSLLVNAILAYACHGLQQNAQRAYFWDVSNIGYSFVAEARRLLDFECGQDSLTTVQAMLILGVMWGVDGSDRITHTYMGHAIAMIDRLRSSEAQPDDEEYREVMSTTWWAIYGWQSVYTFAMQKAPFAVTRPDMPVPEESGQLRLRYPLSDALHSIHHAIIFKAFVQVAALLNDISVALRVGVTAGTALPICGKLSEWMASLPDPLQAQNICMPVQYKLHMWYHYARITLLEPLKDTIIEDVEASTLVSHSRVCLLTLIRLNYLRHGFVMIDTLLPHILSATGFQALSEPPSHQDKTLSTVVLCAKGLMDQGKNFYIADSIYRVMRNQMTDEQLRYLHENVDLEAEARRDRWSAKHIRSEYPIMITGSPNGSCKMDEVLASGVVVESSTVDNPKVTG